MLIQFNFDNYKSFFHEASLDMTATSIKEHSYNLISSTDSKDKYIKVAAIYGANASGKSNVIEAFHFMAAFVGSSFKLATEIKTVPVRSFAFTEEQKSSMFEVFFVRNGYEYQYGYLVDKNQVLEEWLYQKKAYSSHKPKTIFERQGEDFNIPDLLEAKNFKTMVLPKTLFLSILSNAKIPVIKEVFDWFKDVVVFDFGDAAFEDRLARSIPSAIKNPSYQKEIVHFLNAIGVPIDKLLVKTEKVDDKEIYEIFSSYNHSGKDVILHFNDESSGTIKMFTLFIWIKNVLQNGSIMFIDELDAKLHPLLLRYVITMFHDEKTNPNNAQLVYTTHDNYTLTKDLFRRDQIWFVEKKKDLTSELYSLAEYKLDNSHKVRNDASYNKDYLLGRYGGVPVLKEFDMWGSYDEKD